MALEKFLCFDLRTGILSLGVFHLIFGTFAAVIHFILSLDNSDPEAAANQTFYFGADIVGLILYGALAYGAYKESRVFLLPYLITCAFFLVILTLICIIFVFYVPALIIILMLLAFYWYVWYAVLSLYQSWDPHNPNYVPQQLPSTVVYVEDEKPPQYYENNVADV